RTHNPVVISRRDSRRFPLTLPTVRFLLLEEPLVSLSVRQQGEGEHNAGSWGPGLPRARGSGAEHRRRIAAIGYGTASPTGPERVSVLRPAQRRAQEHDRDRRVQLGRRLRAAEPEQ